MLNRNPTTKALAVLSAIRWVFMTETRIVIYADIICGGRK